MSLFTRNHFVSSRHPRERIMLYFEKSTQWIAAAQMIATTPANRKPFRTTHTNVATPLLRFCGL